MLASYTKVFWNYIFIVKTRDWFNSLALLFVFDENSNRNKKPKFEIWNFFQSSSYHDNAIILVELRRKLYSCITFSFRYKCIVVNFFLVAANLNEFEFNSKWQHWILFCFVICVNWEKLNISEKCYTTLWLSIFELPH